MKFIIEDDLRDLYKKEPFTAYEVETGSKLTPGARQFLADRGIAMAMGDLNAKKKAGNTKDDKRLNPKKKWRLKKLTSKLESTEAAFLTIAEAILQEDIFLTQKIIEMSKQIAVIQKVLEGKSSMETLSCKACTAINEENACSDIDDCFEVTAFHMQLKKGKEILLINQLRCFLREIEPILMEAYENGDVEEMLSEQILGQVYSLINHLSQLICLAVDGKECQKKVNEQRRDKDGYSNN
ncbi:hypothetical protein [Clostridium aminobutyricum]|uniref:Ethanolamine utilization cobalamin adenosyltransferase n=1 Tax=Clostridium aminobutyricum TaxID=33953 RepID=A0A939DBW3_CLOAM|nr:hypothetical protein [Clostridium aminobutyricum]MBN7774443.1 hypothetical protein [Clostridium aminobutyricum]